MTQRMLGPGLLGLLGLILFLFWRFPPADWLPVDQFGAWLDDAGFAGMLVFVLVGIATTSIGLPRQLLAFVGGFSYGVLVGVPLSLLSAIIGCLATVLFSRRFLQTLISNRYPRFIGTLDKLVAKDAFLKILILRLQPFGTNLITNVCAGFTRIRLRTFLAASLIGYVPQMLVFALMGSGVRVASGARMGVSILLLLISVALGFYLYRRHRDSLPGT